MPGSNLAWRITSIRNVYAKSSHEPESLPYSSCIQYQASPEDRQHAGVSEYRQHPTLCEWLSPVVYSVPGTCHHLRGQGQGRFSASDIGARLVDRSHSHLIGKKEIFSAPEYKDPAFREAIVAIPSTTPDAVLVPKEITPFLHIVLGNGNELSLCGPARWKTRAAGEQADEKHSSCG